MTYAIGIDDVRRAAETIRGQVLRTPLAPEISFSDDPLRMLRAARFIAGHGLQPVDELVAAVAAMHHRLSIVSAERVPMGEYPSISASCQEMCATLSREEEFSVSTSW